MLRTDFRQWLIYDEPSCRAALRVTETLAMMIAGPVLAAKDDVELRAMGNVMLKFAEAHMKACTGQIKDYEPEPAERAAMEDLLMVIPYLGGETRKPNQALDELHGALFHLDSRLNGMGVSGGGVFREMVRGD